MRPSPHPVSGEAIIAHCRELGFALAGIADAAPTRWGAELQAWLAAGKHGSMDYLTEHAAARLDPNLVLPGARSAIMVADLYASREDPPDRPEPSRGRIARYARGRDYHRIIKRRLHALCDALRADHPSAEFRAFVDTAPILEREYAARAGIGWVGKHTLIINPRLGSYLLLGGVFTTLELSPPPSQTPVADHCGTCTRCIDACPTDAITPHSIDARRCISYLTIEHRSDIDPEFHTAIGDWLYGCDICQEVCPHNSPRPSSPPAAVPDAYRPRAASLPILNVLDWTERDRRTSFESSAMKRATLAMMKRNAIIVAGNSLVRFPNPALSARIGQLASDPGEPELVRKTAAMVAARLDGRFGDAYQDRPPPPP